MFRRLRRDIVVVDFLLYVLGGGLVSVKNTEHAKIQAKSSILELQCGCV